MSKLFNENNKSNNKIEGHNLQNKTKYPTNDELLSITTPHRTLNFRVFIIIMISQKMLLQGPYIV